MNTKEFRSALWTEYMNAEDDRRELRERLENASAEYQAAIKRSQEAWDKVEAAAQEENKP